MEKSNEELINDVLFTAQHFVERREGGRSTTDAYWMLKESVVDLLRSQGKEIDFL